MPANPYASTPISPGDVLRDEILARARITQDALAGALGVSRYSVNQLINERRGITAEMALRLARVLDTTPEFWLDLQRDVDLYRAQQKIGGLVDQLPVIKPARADADRFAPLSELLGAD